MVVGIVKKFTDNIQDIDAIFETSLLIREVYQSGFEQILKLEGTQARTKQLVNNTLQALRNIQQESIAKSENEAWRRLYPQAIVTLVSVSEQILKDVFETLIFSNFEHIDVFDDKTFRFGDVRSKLFKLDQQDWFDLIIKVIYGESNEWVGFYNIAVSP